MPIYPKYSPTTPKYTSQFIDESKMDNLLLRIGQQRQNAINKFNEMALETRDKLQIDVDPRLSKSYKIAKDVEKQYEKQIQDSMQTFNETGNVRKATRQLKEIQRRWQNDPIKQEAERQTKMFREDIERAKELREKGTPSGQIINRWQTDDGYISGYQEDRGFVMPQGAGVIKGASVDDAREWLDQRVEAEKQTIEDENGIKKTVRPINRLLGNAGIENGKITDPYLFRSFVNDIGQERSINLARNLGYQGEGMEAVGNMYIDIASNIAKNKYDYDVTRQGETRTTEEKPLFEDWIGITKETYNYELPGKEDVIGTEQILTANPEQVKEQIKRGQISGKLGTIMNIHKSLIDKGLMDGDIENDFENSPEIYNIYNLKNLLERKARKESLTDKEKDYLKDMLGRDSVGGRFQTKGEIEKMKAKEAKDLLGRIKAEETKVYKSSLKKQKPQGISSSWSNQPEKGVQYVPLNKKEQNALEGTNIGQREIIDAKKGIQIKGDFLTQDDIKATKIVSLPLEKGEQEWRQGTNRNLFLEISGKINPENLSETERQQYLAASQDKLPDTGMTSALQYLNENKEIIKSDKLLVPIGRDFAKWIYDTTGSSKLGELFKGYFPEDPSFKKEKPTSKNL
jgi:hypothetical protein